jgi:hypothetical protein
MRIVCNIESLRVVGHAGSPDRARHVMRTSETGRKASDARRFMDQAAELATLRGCG